MLLIGLAISLVGLESAATAPVLQASPETSRPILDLAAITLVPSDLDQPGFGRLGGMMETTNDEVGRLIRLGGETTDVIAALRQVGLRRRYTGSLGLPPTPGAPRIRLAARVDSYVLEFRDDEAAVAGFGLLSRRPISSDAAPLTGIAPIGSMSAATGGTRVSADGNRHAIVDLMVQDGNLVIGVTISGDTDLAHLREAATLERLVTLLLQRTKQVRELQQAGLGTMVLRLDETSAGPGIDDTYLRWDARTFPAYNQPEDDLDMVQERFGAAIAVYTLDQPMHIVGTDPQATPYFAVWLYRFPTAAAASDWLIHDGPRMPERGYSHQVLIPDARRYGDESRTFSYRYAASDSLITRGYQIFVRVNTDIARVQVDALPEAPLVAVEELAAAQTACLRAGVCPRNVGPPPSLIAAMAAASDRDPFVFIVAATLGLGLSAGIILRQTVGPWLILIALAVTGGLVKMRYDDGPVLLRVTPDRGIHVFDAIVAVVVIAGAVIIVRSRIRHRASLQS